MLPPFHLTPALRQFTGSSLSPLADPYALTALDLQEVGVTHPVSAFALHDEKVEQGYAVRNLIVHLGADKYLPGLPRASPEWDGTASD